jgi:sugar phosphate isomerase/epimerase
VFATGSLLDRETAESTRQRILEWARIMSGFDTRFFNFSPAFTPDGRPKTAGELETQAYQLNRLGQDLAQNGMGLTVHHQLPEMRDDAREWRYTVAHTETGLVSFCLDVDWIVKAGLRPLPLMDTAGARLRNLHLRNPRMGANQELLREGDINMFEISRFLRQMSYDGFLTVELQHDPDTPRQYSLTEDLSLSRWYMQEIFGSRPGNPPVDMGPHVRERRS